MTDATDPTGQVEEHAVTERVVVNDLAAAIEDIEEDEEDAARLQRQDWYNQQISLGHMKVHSA